MGTLPFLKVDMGTYPFLKIDMGTLPFLKINIGDLGNPYQRPQSCWTQQDGGGEGRKVGRKSELKRRQGAHKAVLVPGPSYHLNVA